MNSMPRFIEVAAYPGTICGKPLTLSIYLYIYMRDGMMSDKQKHSTLLPSYVEKMNSYLQLNKLCATMLFRCYNGGTCGAEALLRSVVNGQVFVDWDGVIL